MWTTKATVLSKAKANVVWDLWTDVANWKEWDEGIEASTLSGDFSTGTQGTLTPKGAQTLPFTILNVKPLEGFIDATEVPGAKLIFHHSLEHTSEGLKVSHQVSIDGPAWEDYASTLGKALEIDLPKTVASLVKLAESRLQG
jgi:Polyketide cyclase / dehydrase and lipid transport